MSFNNLTGGIATYSSFDYDFIVADDLYDHTPCAKTTSKLGEAINKWTYKEESMINNLKLQLVQINKLKNARGKRFKEKIKTHAVKIIQSKWRKV